MPTRDCSSNINKPIAQTLFLGASVASFTSNFGWGTQPSQLTVNLVEDELAYSCDPSPSTTPNQPNDGSIYSQFAQVNGEALQPNHFTNCVGINCFVDKHTGRQANENTPIENRILAGKVYYELSETSGLVSKYWIDPDPGFFGRKTRIKEDNTYSRVSENNHPGYKYDIIDTPVYFKMGDFEFGGFVQSWSRDIGSGGKNYTVIINGPQSILNSCHLIIDKYAGSIFSKNSAAIYGSPKNYLKSTGAKYDDTNLTHGTLPNVFNIYGFLESLGEGNYGIARPDERGVSINAILDSLMVLTSITHDSTTKLDSIINNREEHAPKAAFSPFGRIISKCMQRDDNEGLYDPITPSFNRFGVIYPQALNRSIAPVPESDPRCQFVLDLHDVIYSDAARTIKRLPDNIRIPGPIISITDLLNDVGERAGCDFSFEMLPKVYAGRLYHIIKVKVISRLKQPNTNLIENTIKSLECDGYQVSSNNIGKEKNDTPARCLIIGGQQQRLYQVKSYRLAYTQNNFIYNPRTKKFVNYYSLSGGPITDNSNPNITNQYGHGKIRFPNFNSSRNINVSNYLGTSNQLESNYIDIIQDEDRIQKLNSKGFTTNDPIWATNSELGDGVPVNFGNYEPSVKINHSDINAQSGGRWFPLYLDNICPFFGFVFDNKIGLRVGENNSTNTDFRRIRPVWYDTWTAQISVVVRVSELPRLNVPINRIYLETGNEFPLPKVANLDPPTSTYNNLGVVNSYEPVEFFVLTESEIRAALAGFDNYLVYSLAKTYKPDLIELVRRAYYIQTRDRLIDLGASRKDAEETAFEETDWYWKLLGPNIAGDDLYPTAVYPDKNDGSQYIQEKALQDLKIIHKFITDIAKFYGKKYMVVADQLRSYKEESVTGVAFPTNVGYGYIFGGDGELHYNYIPTNDGAWEEYGNIIDDSMVVGGIEWMSLSDEMGKIPPILGYNNNYNYDYIRQAKCIASTKTTPVQDLIKEQANPYFSYDAWLTLHEYKTRSCTDSYVFPSLDLSSFSNTEYVIVDQKRYTTSNNNLISFSGNGFNDFTNGFIIKSYDAWNNEIKESGNSIPRSKLYTTTSVQESFVFLDPVNLQGPRILIDAPGVNLNLSSEENAKDPNRTVITNIAAEDLMIYLKTHNSSSWDIDWIRYMLNYISPLVLDDEENPYFLGLYTVSANNTANNVELAPKAAHPFFVGIPIRSNQFVYGPWTNYPIIEGTGLFPSGQNVTQSSTFPLTCSYSYRATTQEEVQKALNNLITNINIEFNDEYVPWNYGGMHQLDIVAFKEIETKINYQNVIETAQLDMPGLPLFNIGGNFAVNNIGLTFDINTRELLYDDIKSNTLSLPDLSYIPGAVLQNSPTNTNTETIRYKVLNLTYPTDFFDGPIVTSIQTSVGQQGISTTYSFRTYTRKLGLFNKEETDRIKRANKLNLKRGKQIAQISQEITNLQNTERDLILQERLNNAQFGSSDLSSKLFSWSPSMVLIGQASPLINEPSRSPKIIEDFSISSDPGIFNTKNSRPTGWKISSSNDVGEPTGVLNVNSSSFSLKNIGRITSTVQLYQRKEVQNQLDKNYGMQSAMSLDGLLSPISFYPTFKNSTFAYSLHNTANCPFCRGSKIRTIKVSRYGEAGEREEITTNIVCDKCGEASKRLNAKIVPDNDIPINLITLNPIVIPYGEFKNSNTQDYIGAHPKGKHEDISSESSLPPNTKRQFKDRLRHCIEIVARGSVPQNQTGYSLETSRNLAKNTKNNLDYYNKDKTLYNARNKINDPLNILSDTNQRFFGFRGPMVMHAWGYDDEGYPIPNAADEPYSYDMYGRPKRFKLKYTISNDPVTYKSLSGGDMFVVANKTSNTIQSPNPNGVGPPISETEESYSQADSIIYAKTFNKEDLPTQFKVTITNTKEDGTSETKESMKSFDENSYVYKVKIEDDYSQLGGYDPGNPLLLNDPATITNGYKGSIISKTQKWNGTRWSNKIKLNEFYLNWAERPDLWKVGPIDLLWDNTRMVWTAGGGAQEIDPPYILTNNNDVESLKQFLDKKPKENYIYRMIYATLEEDLIKQLDFDETYISRAYIDDIEFNKEPLQKGYRRLIYIKDKTGYCAPRGTKLLCRYNKKTGFYEPVSKPTLTAKGKIINNFQALIDMNYVQGRRSGVVPNMTVPFDNPIGFTTTTNSIGIFTFLNGKWTLTAAK